MKPFIVSIQLTLFTLKFAISEAVLNAVKWNARLEDFVPIFGLSNEAERQKIVSLSRQQENLNFNGQPINVTYFEDYGFFHFYDNDTKATGVCGDIYTLLSKFLNFTLVLSNSRNEGLGVTFQNGSYSGILEYARLNKTDIIPKMPVYTTRINAVTFAPVFWMNSQRIYANGQWKRNYAWMFTLFSTEIWYLIGAVILTLSVVSLAMERILVHHGGRQLPSRSYAEHFFYVCSTLFNQVNAADSVASGSKIFALTISVFCWLILIGFNSHLIYSMTAETFDAPFHNLNTLLERTTFQIAVLDGSDAHRCFNSPYTYEIFKRIWKKKRVKVISNLEALYRQVCSNPNKYVLLAAVDAMAIKKTTICSLIPVGESYFTIPVASGISRRVKSKRSLDIGIMKLHEFGIIDALKKRYMSAPNRVVKSRATDNLAIDMDRVSLIFGILCFGVCTSIITCVAENMHFTLKKRGTKVTNFIKRIPLLNKIMDKKFDYAMQLK